MNTPEPQMDIISLNKRVWAQLTPNGLDAARHHLGMRSLRSGEFHGFTFAEAMQIFGDRVIHEVPFFGHTLYHEPFAAARKLPLDSYVWVKLLGDAVRANAKYRIKHQCVGHGLDFDGPFCRLMIGNVMAIFGPSYDGSQVLFQSNTIWLANPMRTTVAGDRQDST